MHQPKSPHLIHLAYRPDIDGLRALAILLVLVFHATEGRVAGAFIGVDIFFVISGFLISKIIFSSLEHGRFSYQEFYVRRIRRIFPALVLVLLACVAFGYFALLQEEYRDLGKHVAGGAYFAENFVLWSETGYFDKDATSKPLLHLWSLAIEEQFYLLWPVLVAFIWKRGWSFVRLTSVILILSFVANLYLVWQDKAGAFYLPQARFWELMVGGLLAYLSLHPGRRFLPTGDFRSAVGLSLIAAGLLFIDAERSFPGFWALLPTLGAALIISAGPEGRINRTVFSNGVAVFIGKISFPLYLWHWPLLSFLHIQKGEELSDFERGAAVLASFVLAWATYRFVENPFRFGGRGRLKAGVLSVALLSTGALGAYLYMADGLPKRSAASTEIVYSGDVGHGEFYGYAAANFYPCTPADIVASAMKWGDYVRCQQSHSEGGPEVALIGDSHAEHLFLGLAKHRPDKNIVYYIQDAAPLIDLPVFARIFDHVLAQDSVQTVILTAYWRRRIKSLHGHEAVEARLRHTVERLRAAGKRVYLTDDVPNFPFEPTRCRLKGSEFLFPQGCSTTRQHLGSEHQRTLEMLRRIAQAVPGTQLIETYDRFAQGERYGMTRGQQMLYRDGHHLNINGSLFLGGVIAEHLRD